MLRQLPHQRRGTNGKLKEAARAWALSRTGQTDPTAPSRPDHQVRMDAEALGVPAESLPEAANDEEIDVFNVWDINMPVVRLFLDCETQWRVVARGMVGILHYVGIDYASASALLEARSRSEQRKHPARWIFRDLREMERAAIPILNEAGL
ncbi:DUF1799 domain-containing protein [Mesorhizobium sp. AR07]|uniref:DUF1799 domain-containing protein n=1 Tax=Mesorhizobium sp. AR07 TaxID=2865838 RepID=UPI0021600C7F|nr:DUF1799 domain-containing protein [Mesorhizobium sp. AR07]UVK45371.1 DUF1799 domain-containing protein [Mesorhizobium sp. AR07]